MANTLALANTSATSIDLNAVRLYEREKLVRYSLSLSGSYVQFIRGTNTGEVIDLTKNLTNANFSPEQYWGFRGPNRVYVLNTGATGYSMSIIPGADGLHWLLCIFGGVATQLAAGTYQANAPNLLTDVDILIEASGRAFD
jgi:hypothetical protein